MFLCFFVALCLSLRAGADYVNWRTFNVTGVNLGGWLVEEPAIDTAWWSTNSGGAQDEWTLCENLGADCGPVLEQRYTTYITTKDIDKLASAGVRLLRVPTTYAAWLKVPGSQLYSGNQTAILKQIASYAIDRYGMHIVLDVHSLPGGVNGLTTGEAMFHWGWFNNETAWNYSMQVIDQVLSFIQTSGSPESYTLAPINEPADNRDLLVFGTPAALSANGAAWVVKYIRAVLANISSVNPQIPLMFQGSFKGEEYWSSEFPANTNIVFDLHHYYFQSLTTTSASLPNAICNDAKSSPGDGKFPVFVGEWAIQTLFANELSYRKRNLNAGLYAFSKYTAGSSYWTAKYLGTDAVLGEGTQKDYWDFESFIDLGYIDPIEGAAFC